MPRPSAHSIVALGTGWTQVRQIPKGMIVFVMLDVIGLCGWTDTADCAQRIASQDQPSDALPPLGSVPLLALGHMWRDAMAASALRHAPFPSWLPQGICGCVCDAKC
ncbi:hypothetical protein [Shimia sp.]|uniref:hypothetical protein n=1 Tax=Shimia sp. TaxID=1954381 RepID=UPI00329A0824